MPELIEKINDRWLNRSLITNWLEMEKVQRAILTEFKNGRFTAEQTIYWLDECIAAYTRRGNTLPVFMVNP